VFHVIYAAVLRYVPDPFAANLREPNQLYPSIYRPKQWCATLHDAKIPLCGRRHPNPPCADILPRSNVYVYVLRTGNGLSVFLAAILKNRTSECNDTQLEMAFFRTGIFCGGPHCQGSLIATQPRHQNRHHGSGITSTTPRLQTRSRQKGMFFFPRRCCLPSLSRVENLGWFCIAGCDSGHLNYVVRASAVQQIKPDPIALSGHCLRPVLSCPPVTSPASSCPRTTGRVLCHSPICVREHAARPCDAPTPLARRSRACPLAQLTNRHDPLATWSLASRASLQLRCAHCQFAGVPAFPRCRRRHNWLHTPAPKVPPPPFPPTCNPRYLCDVLYIKKPQSEAQRGIGDRDGSEMRCAVLDPAGKGTEERLYLLLQPAPRGNL